MIASRLPLSVPLCVCLLALASGATFAAPPRVDVKTSAQLTALKITVVDLDPDDGVEAGFRFVDGPFLRSSRANVNSHGTFSYGDEASNKDFGWVKASAVFSAYGTEGSARAQVVPGAGAMALPTAMLAENILAFGGWLMSPSSFGASASISSQDRDDPLGTSGRFVVTANTRVTFEALAATKGDFDAINDPLKWRSTRVGFYGYAMLSMIGAVYDAGGKVVDLTAKDEVLQRMGFGPADCGPVHDRIRQCSDKHYAWEDLLSASMETGAGQEFRGTLDARVTSQGTLFVPEPETWALMLAGLSVLALVGSVRRRSEPISRRT